MCQCAAMGCRRRFYANTQSRIGMKCGLCYKHGWWYAVTAQSEYDPKCQFTLWSAGDIAMWLEWCGI